MLSSRLFAARVVKLVDTGDLKSPDHCDRAGSSPAPGTTLFIIKTYIYRLSEARATTLKHLDCCAALTLAIFRIGENFAFKLSVELR